MAAVEMADSAIGADVGDRVPEDGDDQTPAMTKETGYQKGMRMLVSFFSKLNPGAKEFVPSSKVAAAPEGGERKLSADARVFVSQIGNAGVDFVDNSGQKNRGMRISSNHGKKRIGDRNRRTDREESVRRTVYISDIYHNVTEEKLAEIFSACGDVVDCRICGDPHSVLRFAFIEFSDEAGAKTALRLGGAVLGYYPVKVLPSKTAILPVNPKFLPQSEDEKEMVVRTVYCTNIDRKVTEAEVKAFFDHFCGEVSRLRLLRDHAHSTCIAFVEFVHAHSAILALGCSGQPIGTLPIRVSPSKTPVRPGTPRVTSQ